MTDLKVGLAQIKVIPGRPDLNSKRIIKEINKAKINHINLLVFPEMAVPGYMLGDEWENERFIEDCVSFNDLILNETQGIAVIWGNVLMDKNLKNEDGRSRKYNAAFIAQDCKYISNKVFDGYTFKTLLPKYREFDDERHFYSLRKYAQDKNELINNFLKPFEIIVRNKAYKVGVILCEDMWCDDYTINPTDILIKNNSDLIVNISCSPWTWKKNDKRHRVVKSLISSYKVPFFYCNNIGIQNNGKNIFLFDGSSTYYHPGGDVGTESKAYKEEVLIINLNKESDPTKFNKDINQEKDIEELYKGLIYGLKCFFETFSIKKVVIGISGGIDSAVVAALLAKAVGPSNVYGINMPSYFNSDQTKSAALKLAQNLGINYTTLSIQDSYEDTINQFHKVKFLNFSNNQTEQLKLTQLTKENMQARDRGSRILAGVAASLGAIFTNNGNKTETAIGYATLYGDVNGAIAPIADIYKNQVYQLANFINKVNRKSIIPKEILKIVPSAELSEDQDVDQGKGDPINYFYHDKLLKQFIEFRKDPEDILNSFVNNTLESELELPKGYLKENFSTGLEFINDLEHKWKLYKINVFKRIQAPPIIAVSKRAFGYDLRESQNGVYFTKKYLVMKNKHLKRSF